MAPKKSTKTTLDGKPTPVKKGTPTAKKDPPSPATASLRSSSSTASWTSSSGAATSPATAMTGVTMINASPTSPVAAVARAAVARASRPSGATVQRLLNQGKASLPKDGLQAFGIKPASTGGGDNDKNSKLKCVMIAGENNAGALVFRCEPNNPNYRNGSWAEKAFFDAVRKNMEWVTLINVDSDMLQWCHNDEAMFNPEGYNIRLFVVHCAELPSEDSAIKLGKHICQNVNTMPNNNTTMSIQPGQFFWIPNGVKPVWSDVIGSDAALKALVEEKGMPTAGCYDTNQEAIHSYFRPHTFTLDLARVLHAPIEQVHPQLRTESNNEPSEEQVLDKNEIEVELEDDEEDSDIDPDL